MVERDKDEDIELSARMVEWAPPGGDATILPAMERCLGHNLRGVLATVIAVEGSAYRRPGAKMVVTPSGTVGGAITAGCLEGEVRALAADVLDAGQLRVETYDLTTDDTWGLGIGCNGIVDILLEPLTDVFTPVVDALATNDSLAIGTVIDGPASVRGEKWFYRGDTGDRTELPDWVTTDHIAAAETAIATGVSRVDRSHSEITVFVDGISPRPDLVIVGSGNDITPLIDVATAASMQPRVVGFRGARTTTERFPGAASVSSTSPASIDHSIPIGACTYVVLMSHNIVDDQVALGRLLRTRTPYIGLMGPRDRFDEIRTRLARDGGRPVDSPEYDRVYAPVGLDIGGESPSEIAISIVSEILACHYNRPANHLCDKTGPIHERPEVTSPANR